MDRNDGAPEEIAVSEPEEEDDSDDSDKPSGGKKGLKGRKNPNTSKKKEKRRKKNRGKLLMDATVAPSDIKYPTDIDLLNQCREHLETAVNIHWPHVPHTGHKLPYSAKKARKAYLHIAKSKRWTAKLLQKGIREQLTYIALAQKRLAQMMVLAPEVKLPRYLEERLSVIPFVYEQQKTMLESHTHVCPE